MMAPGRFVLSGDYPPMSGKVHVQCTLSPLVGAYFVIFTVGSKQSYGPSISSLSMWKVGPQV